ncbi:MAG: 50S ribosomal protein L7/L12 [Gammaproteobacteria bacterium]|nr:50S ribosomal protein L7/L12 [Gammaproteobacteria bacterium]
MNDNEEPSEAVVALLAAGRKIDAIKLLREERQLGLKEAKHCIDDYLLRHPGRFPGVRRLAEHSRVGIYLAVVLLVAVAFVLGSRFG